MDQTIKEIITWPHYHRLREYAQQFGTDKLEHEYIPYYAYHLPLLIKDLLEIGAFKGASLKMWKSYYRSANIHTIDLFEDENNSSQNDIDLLGITTYKGDQADKTFLQTIKTQFDVIIDDGSHNAWDMIMSYQKLFYNNLKPGGLYVIEDLHCCIDPFYWNHSEIKSIDDTMLGKIKAGEVAYSHLYNDKIAFIKKPCL